MLRYPDLEKIMFDWSADGMGLPVYRPDPKQAFVRFDKSWLSKYLRTMMEFPDTAEYMFCALKQSHDIGQEKWTVE